MADNRRDKPRKRKYRSDGTPTWTRRAIDGPGVWASCVKGKEKQTVGELYDLFESVAAEIWPVPDGRPPSDDGSASDEESELDVEKQIAKEVAAMKRPRHEPRFVNCQTNTPCVVFIACKPPVDPVKLITTHIEKVVTTGVTRTKYTHRLVPVSGSCVANLPEIRSLCQRVFPPFFAQNEGGNPSKIHRYKIELRMRNHNSISRMDIIQEVAKCIPETYTVDLDNPEVFVLVEIFKSVCGVSVVTDYYRLQKFNVMELANTKNGKEKFAEGTGRVHKMDLDSSIPSSKGLKPASLELEDGVLS
ncbi:hypothetical protein BJ138DRAFT_1172406 [Hygrophoropsis aurantiaca]|uniref:Uncharacterized protein n=1 Tax=Hygrophoropsis aurantiaca TaxID=72124 RepID=A0ACB8AG24_9AGAM|nr:hypothetical protein BJ138DRAFT_1172406 [Hygrophoropsis aurantiaca]